MSIKFGVLGGGYFGFFGGAECRFYFYGREDFSELYLRKLLPKSSRELLPIPL